MAVGVTLAGCGSTATSTSSLATSSTERAAPTTPVSPVTPSTIDVPLTPSTTTRPASTTTTAPPAAVSVVKQLTSADSGQTFQLSVGQAIEITLESAGIKWGGITYSPTAPLRGDPTPSPPPNGQLLIWTAVQPGTVVVTAQGSPLCAPPDSVCPDFIQQFTVHLVIS